MPACRFSLFFSSIITLYKIKSTIFANRVCENRLRSLRYVKVNFSVLYGQYTFTI